MSAPTVATKWVYDFAEGSRDMRELLGGKGSGIAEMTRVLGPDLVPAGFTDHHRGVRGVHARRPHAAPTASPRRSTRRWRASRTRAGRRLGDSDDPLLVSVRSGARDSMPGMMDTVLNLGLNDDSVAGLAARTGNARFAWDSYRRLVQMFGDVVCGVPGARFEDEIARIKRDARRRRWTPSSTSDALRELTRRFQALYDFPAEPARAARARDPRGVRLVDRRARRRLPAHQRHPRRLGHRGQRPADGLRQHGASVGLRRGVLARRGHRRARAERRLPDRRAGRGRRLRACARPRPVRAARLDARDRTPSCVDILRGRWSATTATCRTPSSPSRRGACTCCRRATPSARPRPPCASPSTPSTRAC